MLQRSRIASALATAMGAQQYMHHLFPVPGVDMAPLADLLPTAQEGVDEAYRFQQHVVRELSKGGGGPPRAWRIVPAADPLIRHFNLDAPVVAPIVRSWKYDSGAHFKRAERSLQTVEATLIAFVDKAGHIGGVAPGAVLTSSRFPFYAPHSAGFVADLASFGGIIVGKRTDVQDLPAHWERTGVVLLRDATPRSVGYVDRSVGGSPAAAVAETLRRVRALHGAELPVGVVTCGGIATFPVAPGSFKVNFGPLGAVEFTVE
jgi:2-keto-4-pentenoate hydratase